MRKEIYDQAKAVGFRPGSTEFEKLRRRVTADMFLWSLAMLFPASLFGASLGGPLQQLQQASEFFFGSDQDKERAFNATLPYPLNGLQVISPPIMRVPYSAFGSLLSGNWERFAEYNVWTWFPFGRAAHDVYKTVENPVMITERMIGLPVHAFERQIVTERKRRKGENVFLKVF